MTPLEILWPFCEARAREARDWAEHWREAGNAVGEREQRRRAWAFTRLCVILEKIEQGKLEDARKLTCEPVLARRTVPKPAPSAQVDDIEQRAALK